MKIEAKAWPKTSFFACAVFLLTVSGLKASVLPCPTSGTYQQLETLGICSIGNVYFGGFKLVPTVDGHLNATAFTSPDGGGGVAPNASGMDFNLVDTVSGTNGQYGFVFNSFPLETLSTGSPETASVQLSYRVNDKMAPETIIDAGLTGSNAITINDATATITETYATPAGCLSTVTNTNTCSFTVPGGSINDFIQFNPSGTPPGYPANKVLTITKILSVSSTSAASIAHISEFSDVIDVANVTPDPPSSVPEPSFYGVLAGGLAGIFLFAKCRKRTA